MSETDSQIELRKRQIHIQLKEYADALAAYEAWMTAWRARQPKGFRANRRPQGAPDASV